jgi:K+-transporting ATPase ATPase C chain
MLAQLRAAIVAFLALTVVTGVAYPLLVTGVAQAAFPTQAQGSASLIGQPFDDPKYFWSRPSATGPTPYNAESSSASNLGPTNAALTEAVKARIDALRAADPGNAAPIPVDLVTSSGSGLDPHISPAAAAYQLGRVARVRGLREERVREVVRDHTEDRQLGVFGEPRVAVLSLNMALDQER